MPSGPKNKNINRHAEEARERDADRRQSEKAATERAREAALWKDDDPKAMKKQQKEKEIEEKEREYERRRAEMQEQLSQEDRELDKLKVPTKVTKRTMQKDVAKLLAAYDKDVAKVRGGGAVEAPTASDANRAKGIEASPEVVASGVTAALSALDLSKGIPDDRHIGKRAKGLYRAFCDEQLPLLKETHRGMRRSQYNDLLWDMWQKSPQNPFVLRSEARNAERLAEERAWLEGEPADDGE